MPERFFRDNRFLRFDPHKAPRAAAKVGKLPVRSRDSRDGRSRVMTGDRYDRHFADPRFPGKRVGQLPYHCSRHHYRAHDRGGYTGRFQQGHLELLRRRIQQSRSGSIRIFANLFARQQVGKQIGHKEDLLGSLQRPEVFLPSPEQLENTIKIHDLYAGKPVDFRPGNPLEIFFRRPFRIRIAIRTRQSQQRTVFRQISEIDTPGIDPDRVRHHVPACTNRKAFFQGIIQLIDVPVIFSMQLHDRIREAVKLLHFKFVTNQGP